MRRFLSVAALLLIACIFITPTHAESTSVTECSTVIDTPGKYKLANDLLLCPGVAPFSFGGAVSILSSGVRLDLNGHTITCDLAADEFNVGIFVFPGFSGIHIKNGTVSGCNVGVVVFGADDSRVTNMHLHGHKAFAPLLLGDGILMQQSTNTIIKNNTLTENETRGITMGDGIGNKITGNEANLNETSGIGAFFENDSKFTCNQANNNGLGGLTLGGAATGNLIRGNQVTGNGFAGIPLFGRSDLPPGVYPIPEGNTVVKNIVLANAQNDVAENQFNEITFEVFVEDGAPCRNTWKDNQFVSQLGPDMCIGVPVELEDDDVCAIGDDDDDDDDDSDDDDD